MRAYLCAARGDTTVDATIAAAALDLSSECDFIMENFLKNFGKHLVSVDDG